MNNSVEIGIQASAIAMAMTDKNVRLLAEEDSEVNEVTLNDKTEASEESFTVKESSEIAVDMSDHNSVEPPDPALSWPIVHKIEWTDEEGVNQTPFKSPTPFEKLQVTSDINATIPRDKNDSKVVLEVVTKIVGSNLLLRGRVLEDLKRKLGSATAAFQDKRTNDDNDVEAKKKGTSPARERNVQLEDIAITRIELTRLIIHSAPLLQTLRQVVSYYPKQYLTGDAVEIYEPYHVIVHHMAELEAIVTEADDKKLSAKALSDTQLLLDFMAPHMKNQIGPIVERLSRPKPVIRFDDLWYLFKPGEDVYLKALDKVIGAVVIGCEINDRSPQARRVKLEVEFWVLSSDGEEVGREEDDMAIDPFEGEREVTSLAIFPCKYWDKNDNGKRRSGFEKRGEAFYQLLRAGHKQMYYDGKTFPLKSKTYCGPIVVDVATALRYDQFDMEDKGFSVRLGDLKDHNVSQEGTSLVSQVPSFRWSNYQDIVINKTEELSQHHYFLLGPFVGGFALTEKRWKLFDIENISELSGINSGFENLVIDQEDRRIVQATAHLHSHPWKLDFIQGKGEGQIVLLHGPPGVGKTFTVECIAESTKRPLIVLTIADIGLDEKRVEIELNKWFKLAEGWEAILLIDEADIFLERRKGSDIARNSLVSVFLRKMEYFRGLLFLTTNRIGQIDDAFLSRVHVVIGYKPLDDDKRRRIWQSFFHKLEVEANRNGDNTQSKSAIEISKYAKEYVLEDKDVLDLKWNGREIRNAIQSAVSLAGFQAMEESIDKTSPPKVIDVKKEHFASVVRMSRAFHDYMDSIIARDEAQRAQARMERNDYYIGR